ncbi:hypothetical protein [Nitrospira sp. Ecomares 2.1]
MCNCQNPFFLYPVPLSKIVDRVLDYSIRTVEPWDLIDIEFMNGDEIDFERWFEWCDDMTLSISFKNHEHDTTETLEVDIIQVMRDVLKEKSWSLYIGGLEIELGGDHLMVEGKNHYLKNGMVRIAVVSSPVTPKSQVISVCQGYFIHLDLGSLRRRGLRNRGRNFGLVNLSPVRHGRTLAAR